VEGSVPLDRQNPSGFSPLLQNVRIAVKAASHPSISRRASVQHRAPREALLFLEGTCLPARLFYEVSPKSPKEEGHTQFPFHI
jgi:hypothetical protein